jgi:hypothetical protein
LTLFPTHQRPTQPTAASYPPGRHSVDNRHRGSAGQHSAESTAGKPVATWVDTVPTTPGGRHRASLLTRLARALGLVSPVGITA